MNQERAPVLEVKSIATSFGAKTVHRDVTFSVRSGAVNGLIGGSGSGKTVLLREVLGLLRPDSGSINLLGKDVWRIEERELVELRNRYSVLFQDGALFSALSVAENVAAPIKERMNLRQDCVDALVDLRLHMSGLSTEHRDKMPSELSGGMRKRAALARALALEPEILFLDEPTSGLDPITARAFDQVIRTLVEALQMTVLLITHDLDTICGIVDHLIVLGEGRVLASGSVDEVRRSSHPWINQYFSASTVDRG